MSHLLALPGAGLPEPPPTVLPDDNTPRARAAPSTRRTKVSKPSTPPRTFLTQDEDIVGNQLTVLEDYEEMSQSTRLMQKQADLKAMDNQLEAMKAEYQQRMAKVRQGQKKFQVKQKEMVESIRRFKGFILETDTKRQRAEKRAAEENRTRRRLHIECQHLRVELEKKRRLMERIHQDYENLKANETYLSLVVARSTEFQEIKDLIDRHAALKDVHDSLRQGNDKFQHQINARQNELQHEMKKWQNDILVKNSMQAKLQQDLERIHSSHFENERKAQSRENQNQDIKSRLSQMLMSVRNLHNRIHDSRQFSSRARHAIQRVKLDQMGSKKLRGKALVQVYLEVLDTIGNRMRELHDIKRQYESSHPAVSSRVRVSSTYNGMGVYGDPDKDDAPLTGGGRHKTLNLEQVSSLGGHTNGPMSTRSRNSLTSARSVSTFGSLPSTARSGYRNSTLATASSAASFRRSTLRKPSSLGSRQSTDYGGGARSSWRSHASVSVQPPEQDASSMGMGVDLSRQSGVLASLLARQE